METRRETLSTTTWNSCKVTFIDLYLNPNRIFYKIGLSIGDNPWLWLIISLCVSGICGPGMLLWEEEVDEVELFIPTNAILRSDAEWVREHFKDDFKYESIIVTAPNVLDPRVLHAIGEIENAVKNIVVNNQTWSDVCARYMTWFDDATSVTELEREYVMFSYGPFQDLMRKDSCIYQSLLKLWNSEFNLTSDEVLRDINAALHGTKNDKESILLDIAPLLSNLKYNDTGSVIGAKATILNFILKKSNPLTPEWELKFIEKALNTNYSFPEGMKIYAVASRSFEDALHRVMRNNMTILFCGLLLIMIYVMAMIGRCNRVQQRIYLSLMGISVAGQSLLSAYGVCFYFGYKYGPIHTILPFLLLGISVDDMFVIVNSLEVLKINENNESLSLRIAKALEQSGMSVTVTSLTNIVAFAIGMTTVMPFLKSFCMFATMGILFLFIYEIIFFVSCLVLDERRLELSKDGCFCNEKSDWKPNDCSQKNLQKLIFQRFIGPILMKKSAKFFVIFLTIFILIINIWGIFNLEQNFDPLMYLNQESYPIKFYDKLVQYFPNNGKLADIYLTDVDYYEDRDELVKLIQALKNNTYVNNQTLNSWFMGYEEWLKKIYKGIGDSDEYYGKLSEYLFFTKEGQSHIKDMKFDRIPISDYNITTTKIQIQHVMINSTTDQVRAMNTIRDIVKNAKFSKGTEHTAIFSQDYVSWSANQIIGEELIRNLIVEILAVGLVTLLLLRNLLVTFWVICCVLFTLIDLLGSMHYVGLTVEISSSIMILLCAGLAVDYAAHVGLEFTRTKGTRDERVITTLGAIGPAIFNGGLSTFLAFVLLGVSKAYLFNTFFKLFTSVVFFGLFHGLLFLPVMLSLFGSQEEKEDDNYTECADNRTWEPSKYVTLPLSLPASTNET